MLFVYLSVAYSSCSQSDLSDVACGSNAVIPLALPAWHVVVWATDLLLGHVFAGMCCHDSRVCLVADNSTTSLALPMLHWCILDTFAVEVVTRRVSTITSIKDIERIAVFLCVCGVLGVLCCMVVLRCVSCWCVSLVWVDMRGCWCLSFWFTFVSGCV